MDRTVRRPYLELILDKRNYGGNYLDIVVPFLLKNVFNETDENYEMNYVYPVRCVNPKHKDIKQFGFLIFKFLTLPQVPNITDKQLNIIIDFLDKYTEKATNNETEIELSNVLLFSDLTKLVDSFKGYKTVTKLNEEKTKLFKTYNQIDNGYNLLKEYICSCEVDS